MNVLKTIEKETNLPTTYLTAYAKKIRQAADSYGFLYFLHGMKGSLEYTETDTPDWLWTLRCTNRDKYIHNGQPTWADDIHYDWVKGTINWFEYKNPKDVHTTSPRREKKMSLGKWLKKVGATPEQLHEFETRKMTTFTWRISADWRDVLTMSYNRPWTSCMSPNGCHALGPVTDMFAGSACFFFYREGRNNNQPIGRVILRPGTLDVDGINIKQIPVIILSDTIYGEGVEFEPPYLEEEIYKQTGFFIKVLEEKINQKGINALKSEIYDDNEGMGFREWKEDKDTAEKMFEAFSEIFTELHKNKKIHFSQPKLGEKPVSPTKRPVPIPPPRIRSKKCKKLNPMGKTAAEFKLKEKLKLRKEKSRFLEYALLYRKTDGRKRRLLKTIEEKILTLYKNFPIAACKLKIDRKFLSNYELKMIARLTVQPWNKCYYCNEGKQRVQNILNKLELCPYRCYRNGS